MEKEPIYVLKAGDQISPVFESPLGLFDPERWARCWRTSTASRAGASPA
jgi:predicted Ser/Thr protein kinase